MWNNFRAGEGVGVACSNLWTDYPLTPTKITTILQKQSGDRQLLGKTFLGKKSVGSKENLGSMKIIT